MSRQTTLLLLLAPLTLFSLPIAPGTYPTFSTTLKNGMKVIACEKPGNDFVQVEVWYRVGSKDEKPGIRGMAHLFEHMMFRGTKKYPGNSHFELLDKAGAANINAYTSFDRTVYHEYVPSSAVELTFDLESDRMANFTVTQEILNTEREVVGEELRIGRNNWYSRTASDRYEYLYPKDHPYEVDVIGYLDEITSWKAEQCMDFFNNYYSPNNAFLVVVGNVKHEEIFKLAEKYFGAVTKQLKIKPQEKIPSLLDHKVEKNEMFLFFPVQIYSYIFARPAFGDKDYLPVTLLTQMLFTDNNSILNNRLVKKDMLAYGIQFGSDDRSMYPNFGIVDLIMDAQPGNVKVKKAIREEITKIAEEGIKQESIHDFIKSLENTFLLDSYNSENIAGQLGLFEYYYNDYSMSFKWFDELRKITPDDLKRVAKEWFSEERMQVINIKPEL